MSQSPLMIERWRSELADILNERYTSSLQNIEKRHLRAAMLALQNHQVAIRRNFVSAVADSVSSGSLASSNGKSETSAGLNAAVNFDDLELMGDHQVQDSVDSARVLQAVAMESEAGLAAFSARLSTAQGFEQVNADMNPLRPEIFSRALLKAAQGIPVDNAIRSLWFTHGGVLMGQLVQGLYLSLNELLIEKGVAPAAYRVKTKRSANSSGQPSFSNSTGLGGLDPLGSSAFAPLVDESAELPTITFPGQAAAKREEVRVSAPSRTQAAAKRLRRLLIGDDKPQPKKRLSVDSEPVEHRDFGHTLPSALAVLDELEQSSATRQKNSDKPLTALPAPLAQLRERLKLEAKTSGQSLAIEVVSLMIENMASDPRLLRPVQLIIANSEPAFLRLAVTDPRFFSDKSHPARNLLEAIAAESLAFANEEALGFAEFLEDLQEVAALLTEEDASDAQHFARLLAIFEKKVAQRHTVAYGNHRRSTHALAEAEQRDLLARKIAIEILERPDFIAGNAVVAAFLAGPWAQVMAKERLAVDADKTGIRKAVFSLTLGELLWSLDVEKTAPYPKRLAKLIPSVLDRLHGGLMSIDSPLINSKIFFEEVLGIYQRTLKPSGEPVVAHAAGRGATSNNRTKIYLDGLFGTGESAYGISSWLALLEAENSGVSNETSPKAQPRFQRTQPFVETAISDKPPLEPMNPVSGSIELRLGAWIELLEGEQWLRAQLTWISLYNTLFIFTSADGRTHSMNEPLLQYLLLQGQVKVINQEGVLAGALNQVERSRQQKQQTR